MRREVAQPAGSVDNAGLLLAKCAVTNQFNVVSPFSIVSNWVAEQDRRSQRSCADCPGDASLPRRMPCLRACWELWRLCNASYESALLSGAGGWGYAAAHNRKIDDSSYLNYLFRRWLCRRTRETRHFCSFLALPIRKVSRAHRFGSDQGGIAAETGRRHGDDGFRGLLRRNRHNKNLSLGKTPR